MNLGYQTKGTNGNMAFKDVDGKKGIITGYFAHFNSLDSDGDVITPGAFLKTIAERGPDAKQARIKHLRNHLIYEPVGKLKTLKEDSIGLYFESVPGTHFIGQDTVKMIESGLITENSFGYGVVKKEEKKGVRYLNELLMTEGSNLTFLGANERTGETMMKSMGKDAFIQMLSTRQKAVEKFCKNTDATDETIELLLIEVKQLTQIILDTQLQSTEPEIKATLPEIDVKGAFTEFINSIK